MSTSKFWNDLHGGTAILWAACVLPLMMLVAGALDFNDRELAQPSISNRRPT